MYKFLKHFGIYGLVPIISKFIGFLLIPVYIRVFSPDDFGVIEMYYSAGLFIIFFISMEIYTGVGRYFYDYENDKERNILVSTGLWFNIFSSILFVSILLICKDFIFSKLFANRTFDYTYYVVLLWLPLNAIYSYLSVMMRFEKKPKAYLIINLLQIIIRLSTIILLVVYLRIGISGLFWGNIVSELFGIVAVIVFLKKYLSLTFNKKLLVKLLHFSLPILPGLLILGFQKPWANYIVQKELSFSDLGIYSIGLRVISVFTIIAYALKMAWRPYLYEQVAKGDFGNDTRRIFNFFLVTLSFFSIMLSLFAKEIIQLIATSSYIEAFKVVGFLSVNALLQILSQIIGIGPEVEKKTYWITINSIIGVAVTIFSLPFLLNAFGLVGMPIALMLGSLSKFIISWVLTEKMLKINFPKVLVFFSIFSIIFLNIVIIIFNFIIWQKILFICLALLLIYKRYHDFLLKSLIKVNSKIFK